MVQYDRIVLNALLDSYEKSLLFTGENKVQIRILFPVTKKTLPAYFEESSMAYEDIHASLQAAEGKEYLTILWKKGKVGHIIEKVCLNMDKIESVYGYLHRNPKAQMLKQTMALLDSLEQSCTTPVCRSLLGCLRERLVSNRSVKEYVELSDTEGTRRLLQTVCLIESNTSPCYIREFSIRHFADSKIFEGMGGSLSRIFRTFGEGFADRDLSWILAEYGIYHTPDYVYFKGDLILETGGRELAIGGLKQGIGISGEDIPAIRLLDTAHVKQVITIENLTTFFRWHMQDGLILYLGGYHNGVRRALLQMIHRTLPHARYYHFGDIDAGGYQIYEDLCAKTGIAFELYRMDVETLKRYERYGKRLTENDRKRIQRMLTERSPAYGAVLRYMLERDVKLEQECIGQ